MTTTLTQRMGLIKDIEEASEQLCFNIAQYDKEESIDNIMSILYALRIAAITFEEHELQKNVEQALAMVINNDDYHNKKLVTTFYEIVEMMVYPYRKYSLLAA